MFFPQVLPEIAITLKAILKSIFSYKSVTSKIVFFFFSLVLWCCNLERIFWEQRFSEFPNAFQVYCDSFCVGKIQNIKSLFLKG